MSTLPGQSLKAWFVRNFGRAETAFRRAYSDADITEGEKTSMNRSVRVLVGLMIALAVLLSAGCTKLEARDQLNKGVAVL